MRINNNLMAMNTHRQLGVANNQGAKSMEKLSSGFRINRAGDDAAGLSISEKMRGQIRGLNQASSNAQDGISLIQTAEGALNETHAILQRMRELAVQSSTDTNTDDDRAEIQKEVDQLSQEITRIAETTQFNTMNLLDGSFADKKFHIGANQGQSTTIAIDNMKADELKVVRAAKAEVTEVAAKVEIGGADGITLTGETGKGAEANDIQIEFVAATAADGALSTAIDGNKITVTLAGSDTAATANTATLVLASINDAVTADTGGLAGLVTATATGNASVVQNAASLKTTKGGVSAAAAETQDDTKGIDVSSQKTADSAIKTINEALEKVSSERSKLGAMQNRLEHTIKNLDTSSENLQASEARIRDVDMAKEMMEQTKQNILSQASTAMLAQANQAPQGVLQLLR